MGKIVRRGIDFSGGGGSISNPTAASVTFDNANTGLNATNVQDAVTEVNGKFSNPTASSVTFNNTDTGLAAANVQDAVTEVNGNLSTILANGNFRVFGVVESYSALDTEIKKMSNSSFYLAYIPDGTGLIIGVKGSNLYQRQIRITHFDNNITSRLKSNSSTWSEWTSV